MLGVVLCMLCREYVLEPIKGEFMCRVLCYPGQSHDCCIERVNEMYSLGIDEVYSFGDTLIGSGVRVVGKGHAAVVVLARHVSHGVVALKIRRTDSKRHSMETEAQILMKVFNTGYAPRPYVYSTNMIVREFVDGCTLEKLIELYRGERNALLSSLKSLVMGALAMDLMGVDLVEISRPHSQVVYLCCAPERPFFVDFESARLTSRPCNMTKVISFMVSRVKSLGIDVVDSEKSMKLLGLAKDYKACSDNVCREAVAKHILDILSNI